MHPSSRSSREDRRRAASSPIASSVSIVSGALSLLLVGGGVAACAAAQSGHTQRDDSKKREHGEQGAAALRHLLDQFDADEKLVASFFPIETQASRAKRREVLIAAQRDFAAIDEAQLDHDAQVDLHLFRAQVDELLTRLRWEDEDALAAAPLVAFVEPIARLERIDRAGEPWAAQEIAGWLVESAKSARAVKATHESTEPKGAAASAIAEALKRPAAVHFAAARAHECQSFLTDWRKRNGPADPTLEFWIATPAEQSITALGELHGWLTKDVVDALKKSPDGSPLAIGRDRYCDELRFEGIAWTPEQMLAFGEEQLAALQAEMTNETKKLVAEGGLEAEAKDAGEWKDKPVDWKLGLELAKRDTVPVGAQRLYVQSVAEDAIRFAREQQLFPIPQLCEECWRLELSDAETQKNYAYGFYGGEFMGVASPLPAMDHERKLECMRSNARPTTRTVVPHELIPGHHLQGFFARRRPQRASFHSPFFVEGWAVHTEIVFDQHGFFRTPRERIGHLFWRLLRAARIVVSTKYHLNAMTQAQMVDFMVEHAGLERSAAQAEVDRYMTYSPLYQCAYLHGATEIGKLEDDCRKAWGDAFSELRFHTQLVEQGSIPIVFAREALLGAR